MSADIPWFDLRGMPEAYRLLSVFRASNPLMGRIQPDELHWELSWAESFVPLDMSLGAGERADIRMTAVRDAILSCGKGPDAVGPSQTLSRTPTALRRVLVDLEAARFS